MTHLQRRIERYDICSTFDSFKTNLKGLAFIELNITEKCTRKCSFCPRYDENVYGNRDLDMSIETVKEIVNKIKTSNFYGDINICGFGEPFLHKNLLGIVKELKKLNNRVSVTTNGDVLNVRNISALFNAGLDFIVVSCYDGEEKIIQIEKLFEQVGIKKEKYFIRNLFYNDNNDTFALENNFNNRSGIIKHFNNLRKCEGVCYLPFYYIILDYNGDALLCVQDWFRKAGNFGNIHPNTLEEIWNNVKLNEFRKNLKEGKRVLTPCSNCNVNGSLFGRESVDTFKI